MRIKKISGSIKVKILCNVLGPIGFVAITMAFGIPLFVPLTIIGAIALHELGHYMAMKYFTYNNLAFLLVFPFGGIVYGTKKNQKVSEYLVILLAGPLPGMVLGGIILLAGIRMDSFNLEIIGSIVFFLNAINLLPFFPLDGGKFIACLCRIGNKNLLLPLILTILLNVFLIIFLEMYYFAFIVVIQVLFVVLALKGHELTEEFEYDLSFLQSIVFTFVYMILTGSFVWLIIFGY